MATGRPTSQDRVAAIRIALGGLAAGDELGDIARAVEPLHLRNNTFLGEVLLELAADAIEESGATRDEPLETEGIRKRLLPEDRAQTKAQHHKAEFAVRAAAMIRGGVDPALLDEVVWWQEDDLWFWALEAFVIYARAASERSGVSVSQLCERLAERHGIDLDEATVLPPGG